jgi:peptidoglycan/xylan/chitin deacetylase (PgdA/CDA1 family)
MRALTGVLALSVALAAVAAQAQNAPKGGVPAPAAASAAPAAPPPASASANCPGNPNALGVTRTVEIDTTKGPGFGFEHFRQHDFLRPYEVVLTFDDGPWLHTTPAVLAALAAHCTKATFFPIGKHATYYPEILKQVAAAGHTIGSHTWSHQDLSKKSFDEAKIEIEKGVAAVKWALDAPEAPFFRFPALRHPPEVVQYLGTRNIAIFSTDMDSFDFKIRKPEQIIKNVMRKLEKSDQHKGIVLMHDFQHGTADAVPELLKQLKAGGYKVVHMKAAAPVQSLAEYEDAVKESLKKDLKMIPTLSDRPTSSVIRSVD